MLLCLFTEDIESLVRNIESKVLFAEDSVAMVDSHRVKEDSAEGKLEISLWPLFNRVSLHQECALLKDLMLLAVNAKLER